MADIFDYLKRRGVLSFGEDPFNEVDNLVLAMLSYTDFGGIVEDSFKRISLDTADKKYFEKHSRSEAKKSILPSAYSRSLTVIAIQSQRMVYTTG